MNKTYIISLIGMLALLLLQGHWLSRSYKNEREEHIGKLNEIFYQSIDREFSLHMISGKPKDPKNPKFVIKAASQMTPEERASLKGDTFILRKAQKENIGDGFSEIFAQKMQDAVLEKKSIQLNALDSIYKSQLEEEGIHSSFQIHLYNDKQQAIDSIGIPIPINQNIIVTQLKPLGTKGKLFLQATVALPPHTILLKMLYSLFVSFLFVVILFICLYHQLFVIRRARQLLQAREKTVRQVIHDLKSPLNTVHTILDYIGMEEKDDDLKNWLTDGKLKIRQLTETVESMQPKVDKKTNTVRSQKTEINLLKVIDLIHRDMNRLYPQKNYVYNVENLLSTPLIYMEEMHLERCLRNLVENALKYSDDNVEITITLRVKNNLLTIAVKDTGWGIPKRAQKKLGTQFYQVKRTNKPIRPGYGIGLSSVKQLTNQLGGSLTFESTEGIGSTFFINLPLQ